MIHICEENKKMIDINYSEEHEEEVLPFALADCQDERTCDIYNQMKEKDSIETENITAAEIAIERASHSHMYSMAGDKFLQQGGAFETASNIKHRASSIDRYHQRIEINPDTKSQTQSDPAPSTNVGLSSLSSDGSGFRVTNQIKSNESAAPKQKMLRNLDQWERLDHIASNVSPPFAIVMNERQTFDGSSVRIETEEAVDYSSGNINQRTHLSSTCRDNLRVGTSTLRYENKPTHGGSREGCPIGHSESSLAISGTPNHSMSSYHKVYSGFNKNEVFSNPCSEVRIASSLHSVVNHPQQDSTVENGFSRLKIKESMNASTSMQQRDHDSTVLSKTLTDDFIGVHSNEHEMSGMYLPSQAKTTAVASTGSSTRAAILSNSVELDRHRSTPFTIQDNRNITRERITSRRTCLKSFEVAVSMSPHNTVGEVMDVLSNPDLLRIWYEPVNALTVTDRKGGSLPPPLHPFYSDGLTDNIGMYRSPSFEEKEEYDEDDGDIIIQSASEEKAINANKQREQHDGEWIQASTTTLTSPYAHTNLLARSFESSKAAIGFPSYGNINMFIERNKAQVGLSIGPFKGGTVLSHTITVSEICEEVGYSITLIDDVKILDGDEENQRCCFGFSGSCFDVIQWTVPSMDGYIEQTIKSLENLRNLVQCQGSTVSARNDSISYIDKGSTITQPLLR